MSQQFCLKWNNHMNNMMDVFKNLLSAESMVDVTLACDGLSLKAHKMVLSACSPFFQSLFSENPCKHPIVILKDMKYTELKAIIEFMYHGEVNVAQDQLSALMKTAETLRVKGLAEVTNEKNSQSNTSQDEPVHRTQTRTDTPPPSNKRRRGRTRKRSLSDSNRSDDDSNEPKIKPPMSPEIEELSADVTMDASNSQFSSLQSQMPMQSTPSHSSNSFHKSSSVISQDPHIEEPVSADEGDFGVEPAKLLEQTLTTEELNARRNRASNVEVQRRSRSSADHSTIVPTSMSSDTSNQQPDSPIDVKPELLELDPPMSPVAGPSHSTDNSMMMYMDQSSVSSHPGPSGYQDNTALVPQESQQGFPQKVIALLLKQEQAIKKLQTEIQLKSQLNDIWLPTVCEFLPSKTIEDMESFNIYLDNEDNFKNTLSALVTKGGTSSSDVIRRILMEIMTNDLSKQYNWKGSRGEKLPFSTLRNVINLIIAATRRYDNHITDIEVHQYIKKWLMRAPDRDGGRLRRALEKAQFKTKPEAFNL